MALVKLCPNCNSERPVNEIYCRGLVADAQCNWSLSEVITTQAASTADISETTLEQTNTFESLQRHCLNGHEVPIGDLFCMQCGADIAEQPLSLDASQTIATLNPEVDTNLIGVAADEWLLLESISVSDQSKECFLVESQTSKQKGFLTIYKDHYEPDPSIYQVLASMDPDHVPVLLEHGRFRSRAYDVYEWITEGTLFEAEFFAHDHTENSSSVERIVDELGRALRDFSEHGLRHRNICPRTILIREQEPLDLVITDFGSARLSDFDLDTVAPLVLSRYSAPEAIVGGVSAASDWWGLGMILLEYVTKGECFENINDKAFMIHVVTRGIEIPETLDDNIHNLLKGLLARDPLERWQWDSVKKWLDGEYVEVPEDTAKLQTHNGEREISLNRVTYKNPQRFALAAAEEQNWQQAKQIFISGELATWATEIFSENSVSAFIKRLQAMEEIDLNWRFSLSLMLLNEHLPLTLQGEIVTPAWLMKHPNRAYDLLVNNVPLLLEEIQREQWLVRLRFRRENVLEKAKALEIELDHSRLKLYLLETSIAKLSAERNLLRQIYPAANHSGLSNLLEKNSLSEEDLIVLLSANKQQFIPLQEVIEETETLFNQYANGSFKDENVKRLFTQSKFDIYHLIDERVTGFARCGNHDIDNWVDTYRLEKRISLQRAAIVLSIPQEQWLVPEKQEYSSNLLRFFEKRVSNSVLRGALVRLIISKTTSKIDLTELDTPLRSAESLLTSIINRTDLPQKIDPKIYQNDSVLDRRIFRMLNQATSYRRDTGIDSLYIGFPFLVIGGNAARKTKPKIAPVLLWPVSMDYKLGAQGSLNLAFDNNRGEVRLNPALEGLVGREQVEKWKRVHKEILARSSLTIADVMNVLGSVQTARNTHLVKHPAVSHRIAEGLQELESSAVIFNATFSGQAISEDIRNMQSLPLESSSLQRMLRISEHYEVGSKSEHENSHTTKVSISEAEKFSVVPSDPSQEKVVLYGRKNPGLVVEGPPGTGKSQTIVNLIADCIGRSEKVLVVCQKQAALRVVEKRLEAEGLEQRLLCVNDINRDRKNIIRSVREQVETLSIDSDRFNELSQDRAITAKRIDRLEHELNQRHSVVHSIDSLSNMSYRRLVGELIAIEANTQYPKIDVPQLRKFIAALNPDQVNELEEDCAALAMDWIRSEYENSQLACFKVFAVDDATLTLIKKQFGEFIQAEIERNKQLKELHADFDQSDVSKQIEWLRLYENLFSQQSSKQIHNSAQWFDLFYDEVNAQSVGMDIVSELDEQLLLLSKLDMNLHEAEFFHSLLSMPSDELEKMNSACLANFKPKNIFAKINPLRLLKVRSVKKYFGENDIEFSKERVTDLVGAIQLEQALRKVRRRLLPVYKQIGEKNQKDLQQPIKIMNKKLSGLVDELRFTNRCMQAVKEFPIKSAAMQVVKSNDNSQYQLFIERARSAVLRGQSRNVSVNALNQIKDWLTDAWYQNTFTGIQDNKKAVNSLNTIYQQLNTLKYYQSFRLHLNGTSRHLLQTFEALASVRSELLKLTSNELGVNIRHILRRESLLAWKGRIENAHPVIMLSQAETQEKIKQLEQAYREINTYNQRLLATKYAEEDIASARKWSDITRLNGPRYKKLREFFSHGIDLGLLELRPICLMSPDVVSQALPLQSGLFDVIIFDEASQMLVDFAVPAMYRGKRVIISGDEKQMPPTSFFSNKVASDEEELDSELDEYASEAEASHYAEAWNRKEIKDCPDLLTLGKGVLPKETLLVHYRSKYSYLIEYSNHAFYSGRLNIPALHPDEEIERIKPIEYRAVMGTYRDRSNQAEAEEIVALLAQYWHQNRDAIPSIGVVTFNRKQAELIGDVLLKYAEENSKFNRIYSRELERLQDGEDMSFFIKPVENVQGDERDIIIFSTTFGRNEHGDFRRSFGVLGQRGGERRLNVAVTRARDKLIVVTSMPIREISDMLATGREAAKPRDYLQAYLHYAKNASEGLLTAKSKRSLVVNNSTDVFKKDGFLLSVLSFIRSLGYEPSFSKNTDDAFKVDIVIKDPRTQLYGIGIECDSPQHKLLAMAKYRELWRPAVLARSLPKLYRVNSYDWYHTRQQEQEKLQIAIKHAIG